MEVLKGRSMRTPIYLRGFCRLKVLKVLNPLSCLSVLIPGLRVLKPSWRLIPLSPLNT
jgi:hypothetical protein